MLGFNIIERAVKTVLNEETRVSADPDELTAGVLIMLIRGLSSGILNDDQCDEHWCMHFVEVILDDVKAKLTPGGSVMVVFSDEEGDCFQRPNRSVGVLFREKAQIPMYAL